MRRLAAALPARGLGGVGWAVPQRPGRGGGFLSPGAGPRASPPRLSPPPPPAGRRRRDGRCAVGSPLPSLPLGALLAPEPPQGVGSFDLGRGGLWTCSRLWCEVTEFGRHLRNVENAGDRSGLVVILLWFSPAASPQENLPVRTTRYHKVAWWAVDSDDVKGSVLRRRGLCGGGQPEVDGSSPAECHLQQAHCRKALIPDMHLLPRGEFSRLKSQSLPQVLSSSP
ncbi:uncharacterized protein LOC132233024 [Myotis daubentonii]|uniref:uncharacterized protein LOC132233024 n=1 Tax=Myotis daubentonii TaxID=98922 RepID=UPI0028733E07|nr:uncharacterized protein LOC132233024 [Myotis daubentonii]